MNDPLTFGRRPCGVMAYILDYDIVVSQYKLQLCYHIHF